jgi:serine protease Do
MEKINLIEAVERYLRGEMTPAEKAEFEQLRKDDPEVDQLVVEHSIFINRLNEFGEQKNFRSALNDIHNDLVEAGKIKDEISPAVVRQLWKKYKRVMAVAASIAGITTLIIAGMVSYYSRKANTQYVQELSKKFENTRRTVDALKVEIEKVPKAPDNTPIKSGGSGFLIDGKGYLVTNAHVVKGATSIVVQNNNGNEYRASVVHMNLVTDIAILKITDGDFKPFNSLPYGIRKSQAELGEPLFTLGFPREEIVYNEGYMSAKTGFNGDTSTFQIGVSANPGNSGGPVFNKNGEVIGIINTRQMQAEGVVFAITSKNIFRVLNEITGDTAVQNLKLSSSSSVKGLERTQQIKKIEDCVFMVKSY